MLKKIIPTSIGAVALALSLSFGAPTVANAGNLTLSFSNDHGRIDIGKGYNDRDRHHTKRYRSCKPRKAVRKARHFGVRRAHIDRVGKRFIIVKGRKRGKRVEVAFKRRSPYCKVAWIERSHRHLRNGYVETHRGDWDNHRRDRRHRDYGRTTRRY